MAPDGRIGTSNRALGGPVRVGFDAPAVIAILPEAFLGQVVAALARQLAGVSVIVTATASVIVTATRAPRWRPEAKVRKSGGTTVGG